METVRLERDADGIAWVVFDDPLAKVNIFTGPTIARLEKILDELTGQKPRGVIFISGKAGTFIAGVSLHAIANLKSAVEAEQFTRTGHRVLGKIENLGVPTVAAIDGACLGGGCELALACRARVVTDDPKTQIGLPGTQLGIIPGWGGTQRLPAVIGLRAALEMMVSGKSVNAAQAMTMGLVDAVVPARMLRPAAVKALEPVARRKRKAWPPDFLVRELIRRQTVAQTHGHYPAALEAIEVAGRGYELEARGFTKVAVTPECQNLFRVDFLREKYSQMKLGDAPARVRKVGVLGAGVMGAGIAQWCSACGLPVRLKDLQPEFVAAGMQRIAAAYREGVQKGKMSELAARQGLARVQPTTEYVGFGDCDVVIEAVLEQREVKRTALGELAAVVGPDCVIASNTSAIPLGELAAVTGRPGKFVGIHFFNPVHKMSLVEIVCGEQTAPATLTAAVELAQQLKKIPVVVRSAPGFIVNRILMPYLNEAGKMVSEGIDLAFIDHAMVLFGWPMGPLRLVDEIGVDVVVEVAREIFGALPGRMPVTPILEELHAAGVKGRKGGRGFYSYAGMTAEPAERFRGRAKDVLVIQERLMGVMVTEARAVMRAGILAGEDEIDAAMIFGCGFPPFRGGLVKWARDTGVW